MHPQGGRGEMGEDVETAECQVQVGALKVVRTRSFYLLVFRVLCLMVDLERRIGKRNLSGFSVIACQDFPEDCVGTFLTARDDKREWNLCCRNLLPHMGQGNTGDQVAELNKPPLLRGGGGCLALNGRRSLFLGSVCSFQNHNLLQS